MKEIDIKKHELVPKHIILSKEEADKILKKYGITPRHLPRIFVSDPVIKSIGGKVGDVVKIIRRSETAGQSVYYRVVVRG